MKLKTLLLISVLLLSYAYSQQVYDVKRLPYSNYIQRVEIIEVSSTTYINVNIYKPQQLEIYSVNITSNSYVKILDKNVDHYSVAIINNSEDYSVLISTSTTSDYFKLFPMSSYYTNTKTDLFAIVEPNGTTTKVNVLIEK